MKTKLLFTIALILGLSYHHWAQPLNDSTPDPDPKYPYVEVVVTQNNVWLMPDEQPVADIPVQIVNASGEVVLRKTFCSKTKEWALSVAELPSGKYKILIGNHQTEYLEKQGKRWVL